MIKSRDLIVFAAFIKKDLKILVMLYPLETRLHQFFKAFLLHQLIHCVLKFCFVTFVKFSEIEP